MPTVQTGARGTRDLADDLIVQEMMAKVAQLEPSAKPLTTLLGKLEKSLPTDQPEPQHTEDELLPNIDLATGVQTAATLTLVVDNPAFYLVGDILHIPRTNENLRVTAATGVNPVGVVRGVGTVPPAAMVDGEPIWILGGASVEGARSRQALNTLEIPFTSLCQIIRNSIEGTGTQLATRQLGGDFDDQFEKKLIEHKRQMEYFMKFGKQSKTNVGGEFLRTMDGLDNRLQTNVMAVDGILGEGEFEVFLEMGFQFGNARKFLLASPRVLRSIGNFARNRLQTIPKDESYGLLIRRYISASGTVDICYDRELKGETYGGYGILIDPDYLVVRYLRAGPDSKRTAKYQGSMYCKRIMDIQPNDSDTRKDEIFSELTLQIIQERVHAKLTCVLA